MTIARPADVARTPQVLRRLPHPWVPALVGGGLLVLGGQRVLGILAFAAVLGWSLARVGATHQRESAEARAVALVALTGLVSVSTPRFLGAGADTVLVLGLAGAPLVWQWVVSPEVRRVLSLRRHARPDQRLLRRAAVVGAVAGAGVALAGGGVAGEPSIAGLFVVALLPAVFDEAVYRGVLMDAIGATKESVVLVALVQGAVAGAGYGWWVALAAVLLGLAMGTVRRVAGHWQASLVTHLGLSLGLLLALFLGAGVTR